MRTSRRPAPPTLLSTLSRLGTLLAILVAAPLPAAEIPPGFERQRLLEGLVSPTDVVLLPDGTVLVSEQGGDVVALEPDAAARLAFSLDGIDSQGERGLVSMLPHPDFPTNGWLYVYYTAIAPEPHSRLSRLVLGPDLAVAEETVLWDLPPHGERSIHTGGALGFAADGTLLVTVGDHGDRGKGQRLDHPFGKIHRLNPDGTAAAGNPFPAEQPSLWALGLRNPFNLAFDPADPEMVLINDVGAVSFEEINRGAPGANFGWPLSEGYDVGPGQTAPIHAYPHAEGMCAITGGGFFPPAAALPAELRGLYLFTDYCVGWIRLLDPATAEVSEFVTGLANPTQLAVDDDGSVYFLSRGTRAHDPGTAGTLDRLIPISVVDPLPEIVVPPADQTVATGTVARFFAEVDNADQVQWQRDEVDLPGETDELLEIGPVTTADDGARFRILASNEHGTVTSAAATLRVSENQAPTVEILTPVAPATADGGATIAFSGRAIDPEDGPLPASALTWRAVLRHNQHVHPLLPATPGAAGTLQIPEAEHGPGMVWFELQLTAVDSSGAEATAVRAILPTSLVDGSRDDVLRLDDGSLIATLTFLDPGRGVLRGAVARPVDDLVGGFWMFHPSNLELVVATQPGHRAVQAGGLTTVELTLSLLEVATGEVRHYTSAAGETFCRIDDDAFASAATVVEPPRDALDLAALPPSQRIFLRLYDNRFRLRLRRPAGDGVQHALARPLGRRSGLFSFPGEERPAAAVKLLDGRAFSGTWWLFFGSMSDDALALDVVEVGSGRRHAYEIAAGSCHAFADTATFPVADPAP